MEEQHEPTPASLHLRGHETRAAELDVTHRTVKTRFTRALLSLLGFWILVPIVALIPPHIPWALGAFVAGIWTAYKQWTGEYVVNHFEGRCPRCEKPLTLKTGSKIRFPLQMTCYECHHKPVLVPEAAPS